MDIKVYHKETISQPQGDINVLRPDMIDIYPQFAEGSTTELNGAVTIDTEEEVTQALVMSVIYQKGLDPVSLEDGVEWGELTREESSALQLITQLQEAVASVSNTASIAFTTVKDRYGKERLAFEVKAV